MPKQKVIKKQFETYWSQERAWDVTGDLCFFDRQPPNDEALMMVPEIRFEDLLVFDGKKTRITIEVIE